MDKLQCVYIKKKQKCNVSEDLNLYRLSSIGRFLSSEYYKYHEYYSHVVLI